jgi:hypothetical protein
MTPPTIAGPELHQSRSVRRGQVHGKVFDHDLKRASSGDARTRIESWVVRDWAIMLR